MNNLAYFSIFAYLSGQLYLSIDFASFWLNVDRRCKYLFIRIFGLAVI